jgi:ketosteroid isomerase-like protein
MVSEEFDRASFAPFEKANGPAFLENLADDVSWTVTGAANPLKGHFTSKAEVAKNIFGRLIPKMATPMSAKVTSVLVTGDWAVVELKGAGESKGGIDYAQELCWICRFEGEKIVEARIYLDSALVKAILDA